MSGPERAPASREAAALAEDCAALCRREVGPHAVCPGAREAVVASYACPCGATWSTWWSTALLAPTSPLRGPR